MANELTYYNNIKIRNQVSSNAIIGVDETNDTFSISTTATRLAIGLGATVGSTNGIAIGNTANIATSGSIAIGRASSVTGVKGAIINTSEVAAVNSLANSFQFFGISNTPDFTVSSIKANFKVLTGIGDRNVGTDANGNLIILPISSGGAGKYTVDIALVANTPTTITHSLGQLGVVTAVYDSSNVKVLPDVITLLTTNTLEITCSVAGTYKIVVIG
jgi:hypothetical protein